MFVMNVLCKTHPSSVIPIEEIYLCAVRFVLYQKVNSAPVRVVLVLPSVIHLIRKRKPLSLYFPVRLSMSRFELKSINI